MTRRYVILAAASMAMLTACSGSDNQVRVSGPDPVTAPSITSTPDTTQPAPATAPATPATTETVAATSTTPAATIEPAPTTALDPLKLIAEQVQRDFEASEVAVLKAFNDPGSPESAVLLKAHFTERILQRVLSDLATLEEDGLRGKWNPNIPQVVVILDEPKFVDDTQLRISMTTCRVDAGVVFVPGESSETDVVVNDTVRRVTAITEFLFEDDVWKPATGTELTNQVGETSCDDA
jgi:hypothetical protein